MTMTTIPDTTMRNGDLATLAALLEEQRAVKYDAVVQSRALSYEDGLLHVEGDDVVLSPEGVTKQDVVLTPSEIFEEGVSDRLGIPRAYLRKLRESAVRVPDEANLLIDVEEQLLLDANVNAWLRADPGRKFLVRGFHREGEVGMARALLSDRYALIDNLDVLLAGLDGIRQSGVEATVYSADLSERKMRVRLTCPAIEALAPVLLNDYRSPWDGTAGRDLPVVRAGLDLRNSETGGGAFSLAPWILVLVCRNGMTRNVTGEAQRRIHTGVRHDVGVVSWSEDTQRRYIDLVKAQTRDAVQMFCSPAYLALAVAEIEEKAGKRVEDAAGTIERVGTEFGFTEEERKEVLDFFIKGGTLTAGGVMQAATAFAQTVESPDRQAAIEDQAFRILAAV
jgi:hypothetical protein